MTASTPGFRLSTKFRAGWSTRVHKVPERGVHRPLQSITVYLGISHQIERTIIAWLDTCSCRIDNGISPRQRYARTSGGRTVAPTEIMQCSDALRHGFVYVDFDDNEIPTQQYAHYASCPYFPRLCDGVKAGWFLRTFGD